MPEALCLPGLEESQHSRTKISFSWFGSKDFPTNLDISVQPTQKTKWLIRTDDASLLFPKTQKWRLSQTQRATILCFPRSEPQRKLRILFSSRHHCDLRDPHRRLGPQLEGLRNIGTNAITCAIGRMHERVGAKFGFSTCAHFLNSKF